MAKQKAYNIKVYSLANVYLRTINPKDISSGVSFSAQTNGGQGELVVNIRGNINSGLISYNNIIRVYESDTTMTTPRLIYAGIVGSMKRVSEGSGDMLEVRAVGLASMLSWVYFQSAGSYVFTKAQELTTTMQNIITSFSAQYPGVLSYSAGTSTENTGVTTTSLAFSYEKCMESLSKVAGSASYWWTIDSAGVLQYHPKTGAIGQISHKFTLGDDIDSLTIDENVEQMANRYIVNWSGGIVTVNDATSQTANGVRELFEDATTTITDVTTATVRANAQLAKMKDLKRKIALQINDKYDIESVRPGDLATVRNSDYTISALQIVKIEYNTDTIKVELEDINSFTKELYS